MSNCKRVVVTGAAGYIGGQTVLELVDQGHNVIGIDRRPRPDHFKTLSVPFQRLDFSEPDSIELLLSVKPDAIVHCAGTSLVGPSVTEPNRYYHNNFVATKTMIDHLVRGNWSGRFIFSSSAATYGEPVMIPCSEVDPPLPISPYGESKLMVEWLLNSYHRAFNLDFVAYRYFNACGADPKQRHGQEPGATHIIARVLESIRDDAKFTLYGDNYPTPDGTCVRDYVHVSDIARAHAMAIAKDSIPSGIYNLGTATGASNREIIKTAEKVTGKTVNLEIGSVRDGDPALLTASPSKIQSVSDWRPLYNIEDMVSHAWSWYNQ